MNINADLVISIVLEAAEFFRDRGRVSHVSVKGYGNFVTDADKAVQRFIQERLAVAYPAVQFFAEEKENGDVDVTGDFWILDPIDGTLNLMHDFAHSAISLGYAERGVLTFGVIYDPYRDEVFRAQVGQGAYMMRNASRSLHAAHRLRGEKNNIVNVADGSAESPEEPENVHKGSARSLEESGNVHKGSARSLKEPENIRKCTDGSEEPGNERNSNIGNASVAECVWQPIHVSQTTKLADSVVLVGTAPYHRDKLGGKYFQLIQEVFMHSEDIRRFGAAVLDLAWVACGRADAYFEHVYPWDRAAGVVIVKEAGGKVCSFDGSEVPVTGFHDVCVGPAGVVDEIVGIAREIF